MKAWDSEALWLKAKLFTDRANSFDHLSSEFPLMSALALELLARAALTKVHPALNADPRDDTNLLYGFGYDVTAHPRSLPAHSVYLRLEKIVPGFSKTQRELCDYMALLRNAHLHTAELSFNGLRISKWLPRYYEVTKILNEYIGKSLTHYLGPTIADAADKHIRTLNEEIKNTVMQKIAAHARVFNAKDTAEKGSHINSAATAVKHLPIGLTSTKCPACKGDGILKGELIKELEPVYKDEQLLVDRIFLASEFRCLACELTLKGLDEISYGDLETQFTQTTSTSLHELYEPEFEQEYDNM